MEIVEVVERPEPFEAAQFNGLVEPELIEWCEGRLTSKGDSWTLHIFDSSQKQWVMVPPGSWILKKFRSMQYVSDEVYKKHFMGAPA